MDRAETLGTGGFAKVKKAIHKLTGEKVAVKIMSKAHLRETNDLGRVALEVEALKQLNHQNISQLYFVHETETHFFLVLEYAHGGELFDYIVTRERCKEEEARAFFRQIVSAVSNCHENGIAHRDLKPENLLLDKHSNIKLIDFGLIAKPTNLTTDLLKTCCGSAAYAAPELIRGEKYIGTKADMWSLGILLYALLCGFLPFDDENTQRLYKLIQRGTYEIPAWLSSESQRLIGQLLKHKPDSRITMSQLLVHPWLLKGTGKDRIDPASTCRADNNIEPSVLAEMAKYYGLDTRTMEKKIREYKYDAITLNYKLLLLRQQQGQPLRLPAKKAHMDPGAAMKMMQIAGKNQSAARHGLDGADAPAARRKSGSMAAELGSKAVAQSILSKGKTRLDLGDPVPLSQESRSASMGPGSSFGEDLSKINKEAVKPSNGNRLEVEGRREGYGSHAGGLNAVGTTEKPKATRSLFGSLGSLFGSRESLTQPRKVKALFNVKTTSTKIPDAVKEEVLRVVADAGYEIKEKGYSITAKKYVPGTKKLDMQIKFEVCCIDKVELTGIRLSRMRGDTWAYKKETDALLGKMKL